MMNKAPAPPKALVIGLCDELIKAVEELLLAGLTTASRATIERLDATFKEASRMKLLRVGSTLRVANEEIARFQANSPQFSARRLSFFLSRSWLLARAIRSALARGDEQTLAELSRTPDPTPANRLIVVTLGVVKRVVPGSFASFEFRLRAVEDAHPIRAGEPIAWSCVFPMRKELELPAEAFLHLPQKQKFRPIAFLEQKTLQITNAAISPPTVGPARLQLGDASSVSAGAKFNRWNETFRWDRADARRRLLDHHATPLELDVEFQEEIFVDRWTSGGPMTDDEGVERLVIAAAGLPLEARLDGGPSGVPARDRMLSFAREQRRPPLFGVMHYESCRLVFQPLTALENDGPDYLTISAEKISQAELVRAMTFT